MSVLLTWKQWKQHNTNSESNAIFSCTCKWNVCTWICCMEFVPPPSSPFASRLVSATSRRWMIKWKRWKGWENWTKKQQTKRIKRRIGTYMLVQSGKKLHRHAWALSSTARQQSRLDCTITSCFSRFSKSQLSRPTCRHAAASALPQCRCSIHDWWYAIVKFASSISWFSCSDGFSSSFVDSCLHAAGCYLTCMHRQNVVPASRHYCILKMSIHLSRLFFVSNRESLQFRWILCSFFFFCLSCRVPVLCLHDDNGGGGGEFQVTDGDNMTSDITIIFIESVICEDENK